MYVKVIGACRSVFDSVPDPYKTKEMSEKVVSEDPFLVKHCLDRYNSQKSCDEAVDACIPLLKLRPDWFVMKNMIKKLDNVFSNDDIVSFNKKRFR